MQAAIVANGQVRQTGQNFLRQYFMLDSIFQIHAACLQRCAQIREDVVGEIARRGSEITAGQEKPIVAAVQAEFEELRGQVAPECDPRMDVLRPIILRHVSQHLGSTHADTSAS